ncbi:MAG: hypothetical protein RMJ05_09795 [Thermomicrobium sp.]|mgnify:FL=1|nr:hypothetical protein [Thermomicrobium sp.]MDW8006999.1 hypothetical protein [Thermomicrobium sp.]
MRSGSGRPHLSPLHEQGLPQEIDRDELARVVPRTLCECEPLCPPERLWAFGPDGQFRRSCVGEAQSVVVPFQELRLFSRAILVYTHPPGSPPTIQDTWYAVAAASPLLVVVEAAPMEGTGAPGSPTLHLVTVWHTLAPGYVGVLLHQTSENALRPALQQREQVLAALCRPRDRWAVMQHWYAVALRSVTAPLSTLSQLIGEIAVAWQAFAGMETR